MEFERKASAALCEDCASPAQPPDWRPPLSRVECRLRVWALALRVWALALLLAGAAGSAAAQEDVAHAERGAVLIGAFVTGPDTSARVDSVNGRGTDIDLENDLGLDTTKTVARLDGYFWFSRRHRLDGSLFQYSRDATTVIGRTIEFGDRTFDLSRTIDADSDVRIFKVGYTFAPIVTERGNFGITAVVYTAKLDLALRDRASGEEESRDFTAPLPVLGFRGQYDVSDRISLRGSIELFSLDVGDTDGRLSDTSLGADYSFNDRMALGLAYNLVSVDIDADDIDGFIGAVDWGYDGVLLYLKANFGY